jgi:Family of unknown function (DUF5993)
LVALLFTLLFVSMLFAWRDQKRLSLFLFFVTIGAGVYWLKFHATSPLTIVF